METLPAQREKLHNALTIIDSQLSNLKAIESQTYQTSGEFRWNPNYHGNDPINIHRCSDLKTLISIYSYLMPKNEEYDRSAAEIGLSEYPSFEWQGYPWSAWKHDLQMRISLVTQKEKISSLRLAKEKLEKFLTEEDQLSITLSQLGF